MSDFSTFTKKNNGPVDRFIGLCLYSSSFMHSEHFATKSYSHHKTYENFYEDMPELIDTFAEIYLGSGNSYTKVFPTAITSADHLLDSIIQGAEEIYEQSCTAGQSALDEITTLCRKTKYLLTLK